MREKYTEAEDKPIVSVIFVNCTAEGKLVTMLKEKERELSQFMNKTG